MKPISQNPNNLSNKIWIVFIFFLFKLIFLKKNTWIIPLIILIINIILIIITSTIIFKDVDFNTITYSLVLIQMLFSIIFAAIKSINIFNDLEKEGLEILIYSRQISRKAIISSKILFLFILVLAWSLLILLTNTIYFLINKNTFYLSANFIIYSFFAIFSCSLIFGLLSSLISSKFNSKVALVIPLLIFTPLLIVSNFLNNLSTSTSNNMASFLNLKYPNYDSGTIVDTEQMYLNNKKDEFFILPKNLNNYNFDSRQIKYIKKAYSESKNSAIGYQIYSWFSLPSQMINAFDTDLNLTFIAKESFLKNYLFYPNKESKNFAYKLNLNPNLIKLNIIQNSLEKKLYLLPAAFKNKSIFENMINKEIIYARQGAESFDVSFDEDSYTFAAPDNLVGKINAKILQEALMSKIFQSHAKKYFNDLDQNLSKNELLLSISNLIDETKGNLVNLLIDDSTILFNSSLNKNSIKNIVDKKIYLTIALIYYLYFTYNDSKLLKTLLSNDNQSLKYTPSQIKIKINNEQYLIGGYSSYLQVQQVNNNKIIYRYQLNKSDNYLFQPTHDLYSIQSVKKVLNKNMFPLIWFALIGIIVGLNYYVYYKKDYK